MARARNIKPSFFQHDVLGEVDPLARLLFIGMWTVCDFRGCMEYRPKRIKAQLLPYDDAEISLLVKQLDESGLIAIYKVQGTAYIKVVNFEKHQNPHKNEREAGSDIPDISENGVQVVDFKGVEKNPDKSGTTPAESLFPLPSSLNLNPDSTSSDGAAPPSVPDDKKPAKAKAKREPKEPAPTSETWGAYRSAYVDRYGVEPVRNATVNGQLAQIVSRLGAEESPQVAAFYVSHADAFYVRSGHSVGLLLKDAEKLRMEWMTGRNVISLPTRTKPAQMKSFAQQERERGWLRWEEMTGREHEEMRKIRQAEGLAYQGNVIDVEPTQQLLEGGF